MARNPTQPEGGALTRRFTRYTGIFFDEFSETTGWIREKALVRLPPLEAARELVLRGEYLPQSGLRGIEAAKVGLGVELDGRAAGTLAGPTPGPWEIRVPLPNSGPPDGHRLALRLTGAGITNALAWLGRVTHLGPFQRFRAQRANRQIRLASISTDTGAAVFDFSRRQGPLSPEFARRHGRLGMNIVGFFSADLGVGESARCMARAADAAGIATALVPLKLPCKNRQGDTDFSARLQDSNPHGVNVIHVDPPAARDIDHHHGPDFLRGKYNVAYFAWELSEFPDAWMPSLDHFDEVWCPSDFTRAAIAMKSPHPVLTMPHAIGFARPSATREELRSMFGLPQDAFVFLSLFDLNSYAARKNPQGAIDAFRLSGLTPKEACLVVKVQNEDSNPAEYAALKEALAALPGTRLISGTLSRDAIYALEAAADCFVSLHRSEGFGLAVAESMYLGKPAISTDWSGTAEFVTADTGCPVRAKPVALERNHGPYAKGSKWADPDLSQAAEWMRRLAGDPAFAARLGKAARESIERRFSPAAIGSGYRRRLEAIATF